MPARFYCRDIEGPSAELDDAESHHALHVLRMNVGDDVELFDGSGQSAAATITSISRKTVCLSIGTLTPATAVARSRLIVAAAPPRGDRLKSMVEKLTELGVSEFIPLRTVRSVVDPRQSRLDKLRATVIGAMKQCGRNELMTIQEATEFSAVLRNASQAKQSIRIAHPGESASEASGLQARDTLLLIGPEGGFTREEVLQATDYGAQRLSWPDGILRIETASVAFSALLIHQLHVEMQQSVS